ncbi:type II toxin-antitoxin system YhaV family toxin [Nostoc sp. MS1]|nr:type II toxin-antitoxin system YhaV family toxin [Nostoc sp. MS1]
MNIVSLQSGHPPDNWHDLLAEAKGEINRLEKAAKAEI